MCEIRLLKKMTELHEVCGNNKIIVYGAGIVAEALLFYLSENGYSHNIFCIAVTEKEGQPEHILGIPVCPLGEICSVYSNVQYIIATLERSHFDILNTLRKYDIHQVKAISNILYAKIRQEMPSLEFEILQSTKMFYTDICNELRKIHSEIGKIKKCILYQANTYEQTVQPADYPRILQEWYETVTGKRLDLLNPITYNEKIQWIKLYGITPVMTQLTDKYGVREWVKGKIGEQYLVKLLGVWDCFDQIDFEKLPDKFVLKCNHGCGFNMIVKDKKAFNIREAKRKFDSWQNINFAFAGGLELQYKDIIPQIIAEEYLENTNNDLYDYKFWCFGGKVDFIMFLSERRKGLKMNNFDREWNLLPFTYDYEQSSESIPRPKNLFKMMEIAEILAEGFPHVRVDLYHLNNGDIKFGEMTFTSASGVCKWSDEKVNDRLGKLIQLDIK